MSSSFEQQGVSHCGLENTQGLPLPRQMFGNFFPDRRAGGVFQANYRAYPVSFIDRAEAENGDKVFLPPSALDRLASLHVEFPMLFSLENRANGNKTHCGVLEFIAEEGCVYMPYWMMQNLLLEEGSLVALRNVSLPKGKFVKLQPHTQDFLEISNPRAVLEMTLRGFSCLTKGDCILMHYNNKRFYIDIVECRPQDAISVIETDCEVDFAPPLDYVEPSREQPPAAAAHSNGAASTSGALAAAPSAAGADAPEDPPEPKFHAFVGSGNRLDGRSVPARALPPPKPGGADTASQAGRPAGGPQAPGRPAGKVVFPSSGNRLLDRQNAEQHSKAGGAVQQPGPAAAVPAQKQTKEEVKAPEAPAFKAFQGKGHSLRD